MFGPPALTHFVYVVLIVAFVSVVSYMVIYNLRMKAKLKETGAHPRTIEEEIVIERAQMEKDAKKQH